MKTLAMAALGLLLFAPAIPAAPARTAARTYTSALSIGGEEALRFDVASPRMTRPEFEKAMATAGIRDALNAKYLADLGTLNAARPFLLGGIYLDKGTYRIGLTLGEKDGFEFVLDGDRRAARIPVSATESAEHVPQLAIAFLAAEEVDRFLLEIRFGTLRGTAPLVFDPTELISGMNNLAYELLASSPADWKGRENALRLALEANEKTGGKVPEILDTLALAHFQNGNVDRAIETQKQAIRLLGTDAGKERIRLIAQLQAFELARKKKAAAPASAKTEPPAAAAAGGKD